MSKILTIFFTVFFVVLIADQAIKQLFLDGFSWDSEWISLVLVFNKGVAFSMFAFLGKYLKFIQAILIITVFGYLVWQKEILKEHNFAIAILLGGGSSNLLDRFIHGGVVDYVYWHHWFDFAIFNFADVMIDIGVGIILLQSFYKKR